MKCPKCGQEEPVRVERCKADVVSVWRDSKRCTFPVWKDGYCKRHHPEVKIITVERRIKRWKEFIVADEAELVKLKGIKL